MEDRWVQKLVQHGHIQPSLEDAKLSAAARKRLPDKSFAGKKRSYPIHDLAHARAALRLLHHASPAQQKTIKSKIYKKYPQLKPKGKTK